MKDSYYGKIITQQNWLSSSGLGNDIREIENAFMDDPELLNIWSNGSENSEQLKNALKLCLDKVVFERGRKAMEESANRSGQTKLVLAGITRRHYHSIMPQLKVQVPRYMMTLYINVLSGCDFLTPHNHAKKPGCSFCDSAEADWPHLLFECPNLQNGHKFVAKFQNNLFAARVSTESVFESEKILQTKRLLAKLWNEKSFEDLFYITMGVKLSPHGLEYQFLIKILVQTISPILFHVQREWADQ